MATEIAKAYVQIVPSAQGIKGAISKEMGGEASAAGHQAGLNIAGAIKGVLLAAGIGKVVGQAVNEGAALQQSLGGIEALYGDAAASVVANAKNAWRTAGVSANAYMEQTASLSAALIRGLGGDQAAAAKVADVAMQDMADNANRFGTDISSIQNAYQGFAKGNYSMLDNLKLGFGGSQEGMQALLAEAEKLSGVHYELGNMADMIEAIHVVQEELNVTGTTAKEMSQTFSGSMGALKAAWSDLLGNLTTGGDVLGPMQALVESAGYVVFGEGGLLAMAKNALAALPGVLVEAIRQGVFAMRSFANGSGAMELLQVGVGFVTDLVGGIISWLPYMAEAAIDMGKTLADTLMQFPWLATANTFINNLLNDLTLAASETFGGGDDSGDPMGILNALTESILGGASHMLDTGLFVLNQLVLGITNALPGILDTGIQIITWLFNSILQALPMLITAAGEAIHTLQQGFADNLPTIIEKGMELIGGLVQGIRDNLPEIINAALDTMTTLVTTFLENLPMIIEMAFELIGALAQGIIEAVVLVIEALPVIWDNIVEWFKSMDWGQIGRDLMQGIKDGIEGMISNVVQAAKDAGNRILTAVKDLFGIASPSKVFAYYGKMDMVGLAKGIEDNADLAEDAAASIAGRTIAALGNVNATVDTTAGTDLGAKLDYVAALLAKYLPECADNGVDGGALVRSINRGLGVALV